MIDYAHICTEKYKILVMKIMKNYAQVYEVSTTLIIPSSLVVPILQQTTSTNLTKLGGAL